MAWVENEILVQTIEKEVDAGTTKTDFVDDWEEPNKSNPKIDIELVEFVCQVALL